jgi:hypothetical protein
MAFTEVKAPEQLRFEKTSDSVQGVLIAITPHTVKDKKTIQYTLEKSDGSRVTFLATWDLAQKITPKMRGLPISVTFEKYHDSIERDGNRAKVFKVMVDWDAKPSAMIDSLDVGDHDIPF